MYLNKFFIIFIFFIPFVSMAAEQIPIELKDVGIEEHLGQKILLDTSFIDEKGEVVQLQKFFDGKRPVILLLVYYNCPNICHYLLNGFLNSLKNFSWGVGKEFEVVAVSFDPRETSREAIQKKENLKLTSDFHFLVGKEENIKQLTEVVGFHYRYDERQKEYAHPSVISILTPDGRISRYLYGIEFKSLDLKLALLEASQGKIGSVVDKLLLFCYHYDPLGRKYALFATRFMSAAGAITVIVMMMALIFLLRQ